jgi:predicted GNAT family acetyltransferase
MKRLAIFLAAVLMVVSTKVIASEVGFYDVNGSDERITRTYNNIGSFDAVSANTYGDIYVSQTSDGSSSLRIIGEAKYVERIKVVVIEGVLTITNENQEKNRMKVSEKNSVRIEITAPTLKSMVSKGVGDVLVNNKFVAGDLQITLRGVGDVKFNDLQCQKLKITHTGVGDVELKGRASTADMTLTGVGDIEAYDFKVDALTVLSKGVGDLECYATKSINAESRGVGEIKYKGSPSKKQIVSKGIGGVKHK